MFIKSIVSRDIVFKSFLDRVNQTMQREFELDREAQINANHAEEDGDHDQSLAYWDEAHEHAHKWSVLRQLKDIFLGREEIRNPPDDHLHTI